jgi:hypothetical protein
MKRLIGLLAAAFSIFVLGSCSLIGVGGPTTSSGTVPSNYPDSVVYRLRLSDGTYLCSSFKVSSDDAGVSVLLNDVYSVSSDGKITWVGKGKQISAVTIEKISK